MPAMPAIDSLLTWPSLVWVVAVMVVGALAHGTMGFGFPLIVTPLIALATDIHSAVVVSLLPNIAVNLVSVVRGGRWRASIAPHWPVAVYVVIGTALGTRLLLLARPEPLQLLLAAMIVVFLWQSRIRVSQGSWLARHARASAAFFGLLAGVMSGSVNVAVPPLVIYFMALGLPAVAMTQILNLCFLAGRATQAATLGLSSEIALSTWLATLPLTAISLAALFVGMRLQRRIDPDVFRGLLRKGLWLMAVALAAQALLHIARM